MNAPEMQQDQTAPANFDLAFWDIFRFYYRKRIQLLVAFAITFVASSIFLATRQEVYGAHAVITSAAPEGSSGGLSLTSGIGGLLSGKGASTATPEFMEYVSSFETMRLARSLSQDPVIMHKAFSDQWDEKTQKWHQPRSIQYSIMSVIRSIFSDRSWRAPNSYDLEVYISQNVSVKAMSDSTFYELNFNHHDKNFAGYFLKSCMDSLDEIMRKKRFEDLSRREYYLRKRLEFEKNSVIVDTIMQQMSSVMSNIVYLKGRDYYSITAIDPVFVYTDPVRPRASFTIVISFLLASSAAVLIVFLQGIFLFVKRMSRNARL